MASAVDSDRVFEELCQQLDVAESDFLLLKDRG